MAVGIVDRQKLVNIADAVRAKKGITGNMTLDAIASNITSIPTADNNAKFDFSRSGSNSGGDLKGYLTTIDLTGFDASNYTNMYGMFSGLTSIKSLDVSNLDTSNVTDMSSMFNSCNSLTSLDLSSFNTSKVTNMNYMFDNCSSLTSLNLSNWNTSSVGTSGYGSSFKNMFSSCSSLKSLDISSFDLSNTYSGKYYSLGSMFYNCNELKTLKLPKSVSFNKTDIFLNQMFSNCNSLESLDLSGWNTTNVTDMSSMFPGCYKLSNLTLGTDWASNSSISSFNLSYCPLTRESAVDVINKLATRDNSPVIEFSNAVGLYQSEIDIATNKGWSVSGCSVLAEDATTATVGQSAFIDGVFSICAYVADTPQAWGQRIFYTYLGFTDSNGNSEFQWGGYGTATGITATEIGTGLTNTNSLIAMNLQSTDGTPTVWDAIKEFRSTNGDRWFLPSKDEALKMSPTWTSSEVGPEHSWKDNMVYGVYSESKYTSASIRPFTYV